MRVHLIRKHLAPAWGLFSRLAMAVVILELLLLLGIHKLHAATSVAVVALEAKDGYTATRVYAGKAVAGRASELGFKHGGEVERQYLQALGRVDNYRMEGETLTLAAGSEVLATFKPQ